MFKKFLSLSLAATMVFGYSVPTMAQGADAGIQTEQTVQTEVQDAQGADVDDYGDADVDVELTSQSEEEIMETKGYEVISEEEMMESVTWNVADAATVDCDEYYGNNLTGTEADMYAQLADMTPDSNTIEVTIELDGETYSEACEKYKDQAVEQLKTALTAYMLDHPEKMYFNSNNGMLVGGGVYDYDTITFSGSYKKSQYYTTDLEAAAEKEVDTIANSILDEDAGEQIKDIHDAIILHATYDFDALEEASTTEHFYFAHGPLGILLNDTGVCESYAKVFKILCNRFDIPCVCVRSSSHMWNYVQMDDGQWYLIDCTWDDPNDVENEYIDYSYYLISNNPVFDESHTPDNSLSYPTTATEEYTLHNYGEWTKTKAATCSEYGQETATCTDCNKVITRKIAYDTDNHVGGTEVRGAKAATCEAAGYTGDTYCKGCEKVLEEGSEIAALGHKLVTIKGYAATALKTGKTDGKKCSVCGKVVTAQKTIAKLKPTIKLSATSKTLKVKKTYTLTISKLAKGDSIKSVVSSKKTCATVKKVSTYKYKITAKKKGTAYIKVTLKSGKTAKCKVVVK